MLFLQLLNTSHTKKLKVKRETRERISILKYAYGLLKGELYINILT